MQKLFTLLLSLPLCATALAQEDMTAKYLTNPSFESDDPATLKAVNNNGLRGYTLAQPKGWAVGGTSVTDLLVNKDCYADNNFGQIGSIPDGDYAYYLRMGWSTGTTTLTQTISSLPAGTWELSADVKTGYANSASSSYTLTAGDESASGAFVQGSANFMPSNAWTTVKVKFIVSATKDVTVSLSANWLSGGSCIAIDNFRLVRVSNATTPGEEPTESDVKSYTEGVINSTFVGEGQMQQGLLDMLAKFTTYLKSDFQQAQAPNSAGEACGCFKSNSTMQNNEDGVRSNADLGMICAFLSKYGRGKVTLPAGVTWDDIDDMAMKSLVFAYSTHKANKLKVCAGNNYWGSVSNADHTWESSLWAMSVAYSAYFLWDKLSDNQKGYIEKLLKAECNYELQRTIPTGYVGDTKAEENGWEACVLAATLGLFPDDDLAPQWYNRLREFAINSYSAAEDKNDNTVVDPDYDTKTVADLYKGQNLYSDYTLQNHNYFHTSYQNVVIQELGEAALALHLFQTGLHGTEKWKTNALMHHNLDVQKKVLNWLALADGELAMPNGNDWSLFLYDQITSYTTNATMLHDADALMLENLAYKMIQARQQTTTDGSWLLRSDIGARRMGVEAHRVMMTYLMHDNYSTADLQPSDFEDFRSRYADSKLFTTQNIVRGYSKDRFTTFAWQPGISSYTGYIAANSVDKNKIIVPFKANNTGNFLGWYTVSGKNTNATPVVSGTYQLAENSPAWAMNGELSTNDATLDNRFAIYSTPGNAVIYLDNVTANQDVTVSGERGGLMAISTDELTRLQRTFYYGDTHKQLDGSTLTTFETPWINIDNALGVVAHNDGTMAFGDRANNNSIMTAKLYAAYDAASHSYKAGDRVGARNVVYYSNITADDTRKVDAKLINLRDSLPNGWNGVIAADPDGSQYLLISNFASDKKAVLSNFATENGAPVFSTATTVADSKSTATFALEQNQSVAMPLQFFIDGSDVEAVAKGDSAYITSAEGSTITVRSLSDSQNVTLGKGKTVIVKLVDGKLKIESATAFPTEPADTLTAGFEDISDRLANPNFELDKTYGDQGRNVTASNITYSSCYINKVSAANSKWQNVLPVEGWTAASTLAGGSNFCRMYSMPYSSTLYCVSPNGVGNYADRVSGMMADDSCGLRTLTVLNSWDKGDNAITQSVTLPAGQYRVLMNVRYVCPNQTNNDGKKVTASNGNVNTSLTGVSVGGNNDYRYPSEQNGWQTLVWDIVLSKEETVTLSCGYNASTGAGAANNTLLYVDNVRLLRRVSTGIKSLPTAETTADSNTFSSDANTYSIDGKLIPADSKGIVIFNGRKLVRK